VPRATAFAEAAAATKVRFAANTATLAAIGATPAGEALAQRNAAAAAAPD
jgi:hypothetical protein